MDLFKSQFFLSNLYIEEGPPKEKLKRRNWDVEKILSNPEFPRKKRIIKLLNFKRTEEEQSEDSANKRRKTFKGDC